jgi:hypothetical protein|tara:strand:- start:319 stop:891 length:573 start_codon:yes stop_codon:yes gene_type:complete
MKYLYITLILLIPILGFGQKIDDKKDDFTGDRIITYSHKSLCRPLIDSPSILDQFFLCIDQVKQINDRFLMRVLIPMSTYNFTSDGYLWVLFEDGSKTKCLIEIYDKIIVFPKKNIYGYDESLLEFYINKEFIEKLSNGHQMKSVRFMTQDGYIDYTHTGFKSKTKEVKRKKDVVEYFTGIKEYSQTLTE